MEVRATIHTEESTTFALYTINGEDAGFASDAWAALVDAGVNPVRAERVVERAWDIAVRAAA